MFSFIMMMRSSYDLRLLQSYWCRMLIIKRLNFIHILYRYHFDRGNIKSDACPGKLTKHSKYLNCLFVVLHFKILVSV